ncbi:SDR family NAD(P)-dependent oxidoreductase [Neobacillus sp. D3-1R]|uniref:SDR family NAD(P)-dependent oxidoreductase n=1 Tax=Neobacillus sp. D3-1R TaxID=3445778 RepID=UPI003FA18E54
MPKYNLIERFLFFPTYINREKLKNKLQGKTILITGASSGIGEQVADFLGDFPVQLILVARREEKLLTLKTQIEKRTAKVSVFSADLRNQEEVQNLLAFIHQLPAGLDIVVSNAGKSIRRSIFHSLDRYHDFTRTMAINYFAPVQLLLSLIPLLQKNQGQIINISTINALLWPFPYWAAYQASKTAFDTWFRSVGPELHALGISTSTIYLPLVKTPMIQPTRAYQTMPAMSSQHVAKIVCKSMYTKKKTYKPWWIIFGQFASLIFGKYLERLLAIFIRKKGGEYEDN